MGDFRGSTNYYRPMMSLGYLVSYHIFGLRPWGYHLANLAANLCVVLLVFFVTCRMFRSNTIGMAAACIFALHPIHSEVVDWIAAVTEFELALFYLLTFWFSWLQLAQVEIVQSHSKPPWRGVLRSHCFPRSRRSRFLCLRQCMNTSSRSRSTTTFIPKVRRYTFCGSCLWLTWPSASTISAVSPPASSGRNLE